MAEAAPSGSPHVIDRVVEDEQESATGRTVLEALKERASYDMEVGGGRRVSFELAERDGTMIVVVKDGAGQVIREIPPEELREAAEKMEKISGVFLDRLG